MKISDKELCEIAAEDAGRWMDSELAAELLQRRREVRRLRAALKKLHSNSAVESVWDEIISAALKPKRKRGTKR